jgi:hypothetical protein
MGDKYTPVLKEALLNMNQVKNLRISNNRLTDEGILEIFSNKSILPMVLDLAHNSIGVEGIKVISDSF